MLCLIVAFHFAAMHTKVAHTKGELPEWTSIAACLTDANQSLTMVGIFDLFLSCVVSDKVWKQHFKIGVAEGKFWKYATPSDIAFLFFVLQTNWQEWMKSFSSPGENTMKKTKEKGLLQRIRMYQVWYVKISKMNRESKQRIETAYRLHRKEIEEIAVTEVEGASVPGTDITLGIPIDFDADDDDDPPLPPLNHCHQPHPPPLNFPI